MKIFIGADHGGYSLKNVLYKQLVAKGHQVTDCGPQRLDPEDDYPDYARKVADGVSANPDSRGILLCRSGLGVGVVANKFKGVRAGLGYSANAVMHGRVNDNLNVLCLAADAVTEHDAEALVELFLITPFGGEERNLRRLKKIADIEDKNFK